MFTYPNELVSQTRKAWKAGKLFEKAYVPSLPGDKVLNRLLEVSYHASFLTEESRKIGFRIVFGLKSEVLSEQQRHPSLGTHPEITLIQFQRSRTFNEKEILRLAPATDPTNVLICVGTIKNTEELEIWGLIDAGKSWWSFLTGDSDSAKFPPNLLTISVAEPGNLTISRQGIVLIHLRNGNLLHSTRTIGGVLFAGPIGDFFSPATKQIYTDVGTRLNSTDQKEGIEYVRYLQRLIFRIRASSHGGTLIVVPDSFTPNDPALKNKLIIKYPCIYDRVWDLLVNKIVHHHKYYELYFRLRDEKDAIVPQLFRDVMDARETGGQIDEALSDSVKFLAVLSNIDGAVVITDRLRLLGFGAEVIVPSVGLDRIMISKDEFGETGDLVDIEMFGTRHRSAMRFCNACEWAIAFVLSQDGGVKVIKKQGEKLIMWQDIRWGLFGF